MKLHRISKYKKSAKKIKRYCKKQKNKIRRGQKTTQIVSHPFLSLSKDEQIAVVKAYHEACE